MVLHMLFVMSWKIIKVNTVAACITSFMELICGLLPVLALFKQPVL
jgi:hypothetical protein